MNTRIIVLAAGKGTRMKMEMPKALAVINGKPIVEHLLISVAASGVDSDPVVVVGFGADEVKRTLGDRYAYVLQEPQLGTGHAVRCAEPVLRGKSDAVMVLYADQPFIRPATIRALAALHEKNRPAFSLMTTTVPDFNDWRAPFFDFGKIVRDGNGNIVKIVEKKDRRPEEDEIKEINPTLFCFDAGWLWEHLPKLTNDNAQKEYYLTDLAQMAIKENAPIASASVAPEETIGVNTKEHLGFAELVAG